MSALLASTGFLNWGCVSVWSAVLAAHLLHSVYRME